ncbi:DUF5615 family PIN-like protein [[Limnothrix rosea] IAM M-220]|uniref:DUF5615 family PIN-like protein n=1 Tax=[Limnothrix rosea] IAM M-220 TaxID=454133 RepID=UPI001F465D3C|nr:DUF5615 family PIN-like protein [[Limnothrix rosea] IAM M-220]
MPSLVKRLADVYPESSHVYLLGLDEVEDIEILKYAKQKEFLVVTKDADFNDLSLIHGFPPKIIWIRRGNCKTSEIEAILRNHYKEIELLVQDSSVGILTLF